MSEEERTGSSSTPLKTVSSAPGAHQASHSSTTGAKVRTLQDVQRDIQKESVEYDQAMAKFEDALSAYESALAACNKDPNDKVLSKELADAKYSRDSYKCLLDISAQFLASLEPERARLQAAADASSEQKNHFRHTPKPYIPNCRLQPDANGEFPLRLDAEIEPIPCGFAHTMPSAFTDEQKAVVRWNCTAFDDSLSDAVVGLLRNRINGNVESARSFFTRNFHFLKIISIIAATRTEYAAMNITLGRNTLSPRAGIDAVIYEKECPALVIVEEQAMGGVGAERELCDNFVFLPHYARLTRVVGIVIVGHTFKIGFVHRDPKRFEALMTLTTGQDGNGYTLIRAAVNIGLWFRATMNRGVLERLPFRFGVPLVSPHRRLKICMTKFQKILLPHDDIDLEALSQFYESIRSQPIPYFEYPVNDEGKTNNVDDILYDDLVRGEALELDMKPVGLQRQPRTSDELKDCLVCILTALQDLHGRGYVHLDLRWPNVIIVSRRSWYIIGGEYVRKAGDPYPQNLRICDDDVVDSAVDLTLLGKMLDALDDPRLLTSNVKELIKYLTKGRTRRSAEGALQLVQGW